MNGLVLKSTGSWYHLMLDDGNKVDARLRGALRLAGSKSTNPVAVGDKVMAKPEVDGRWVIHEILSRSNHLIRRSVNLSKRTQVIAANMDQAVLICTIADPKPLYGFMDRFLATTEAYDIPAVIVFNKIDLCGEAAMEELQYREAAYGAAGYPCLRVSAVTGEGLEAMVDLLRGKVSLLSGHSGVGKSTLANAIQPGLDLRTTEISAAHGQGLHTTTFAQMHPLDVGGYVIDTPGIRGFGLVNMESAEISHYFPEIFAMKDDCKFSNCLHAEEPSCAVRSAAEEGKLAPTRYRSYLSMLSGDELDEVYRQDHHGPDSGS